jgi:hypothetical protein
MLKLGRVALPNGKYEVICYFCSGGSEPLEINLTANVEKKIEKLRIRREMKPSKEATTSLSLMNV